MSLINNLKESIKALYKGRYKLFFNLTFDSVFKVCIPGLHITLGVYLELFNLFEMMCRRTDVVHSYHTYIFIPFIYEYLSVKYNKN